MRDFYISKIFYTGPHVETASIELKDGLNIICGPSNTGKSYIAETLDFMFGGKADDFPIEKSTGYDTVHMLIVTYNGNISLTRGFEDTKINVSTTNPDFENGDYTVGKSKKLWINNFWLQLMGIDDPVKIVAKDDYSKNNTLTLRAFSNVICVKEESVVQKGSILFPPKFNNMTAMQSILLYLLYRKTYVEGDVKEATTIKQARKQAVKDYINSNLSVLSSFKMELAEYNAPVAEDIQAKIEATLAEITDAEGAITIAVTKSKELSNQIIAINDQLAEGQMMVNRFNVLRDQYQSDIKRLTFIVEGDLHKADIPEVTHCPFCDGELPKKKEESCVKAAKRELGRILPQLSDIDDTEAETRYEQEELSKKAATLTEERRQLEITINMELKPRVDSLKKDLSDYRRSIEVHSQGQIIENFEKTITQDLYSIDEEEETLQLHYNPKERFTKEFRSNFDTLINEILTDCNFANYSSSYFDLSSLDLVINGKKKKKYGKGYRAFINSVFANAFMRYLSDKGEIATTLLLIDSPILSLKENKDNINDLEISSGMRSSLFQYMVDNQQWGQTIIIENEIPNIDYKDAKIIRFSHDVNSSERYGLLMGVTD